MIIVCGVKGTGKTTLTRALVKAQARRGRVYVLDIHGEYNGVVTRAPPFPRGVVGRPLVYRPHPRTYPARSEQLAQQCDAYVEHVSRWGGTLVLDEVGALRGPLVDRRATAGLGRIAVQGRHPPPAGAILASQRMQHFWPETRTDGDVLLVFRQTAALDVDLLLASVPRDIRGQLLAIVPYLPNYHYLRLDMTGGRLDLTPHVTNVRA